MQELGESGKGEIANSHFGISKTGINTCLLSFPYHAFCDCSVFVSLTAITTLITFRAINYVEVVTGI